MQTGCWALFVAPFGALVFAALRQWEFAVAWVLLVGAWLTVSRQQTVRDEARLNELLQRAFASRRCPPPALKQESHYGFPAFELIFDSPTHQAEAERTGAIVAFKEIVQQRYAHAGNPDNPFNAEIAVRIKCANDDSTKS